MLLKREHSIVDDGVGIAVISGYTFTSPSLYLEVIGTAKVTDFCGQIGSVYTNITFPVSALSTISYNVPIGSPIVSDRIDPSGGITKILNTADLACPTWGIETPNGGLLGYTVGPPFLPIIVPPPELLSFDPSWASCSYVGVANFIMSYGIFDPPRILTPQAYLTPSTTAAPTSSTKPATREISSHDLASPGSRGSPTLPFKTVGSLVPDTNLVPIDPTSTPLTDIGADDPAQALETTAVPSSQEEMPPSPASPVPSFQTVAAHSLFGSPTAPSQTSAQDPPPLISPMPSESDTPDNFTPSKTTINLGGIIYSAFGPGNISPDTISAASQAITRINPSAIALDGKTLVAGGRAATVSVSLAQSGVIIVGTAVPLSTPPTVTVGHQVYTVKPIDISNFVVAGYTLTPGGPAATVSGTPISLGQSGVLVIDTSSIYLSPTPSIQLGSQTYAVNPVGPSEIAVAGSTLTAGGAGLMVSGTPVSLLSDILVVGSSSIDLAPRPTLTDGSQTHVSSPIDPSDTSGTLSTLTTAMTSVSTSRINDTGAVPFYGESVTWGPDLLQMVFGFGIALAIHWR
ncbi:hypothetical protein MMC22_005424 [Lobaria immixta]|nr:hypothetical protein [Lobaria immixta]